jgi:formate hydrogenlyase transcriptional activator
MLAACVGTAALAVDEEHLFQSVCDTLVKSGLFALAWFGYADESTGKIAAPVVSSGDSSGDRDGFLDELKLALSQDEYDDPASEAIRTGEVCWIRDLPAHPGVGAMRFAFERCGFTSVLSTPLISEAGERAALTLYYDDPEIYGEGIAGLLKENLAHLQTVFAGRPATPRSRSEELERELRNLLDVLPQHVGLTDAGGMLLHLNRAAIEYHGYTVQDFLAGAGLKLIHPEDYQQLHIAITAGFVSGAPFEFEVRYLRTDHQYRWFLGQVTPIRDEDGRIVRWCTSATDIEERKRAAEKIRQSEADLLEAQRLSHMGSWKLDLASGTVTTTPETARVFAVGPEEDASRAEFFFERIHPDDRPGEAANYDRALRAMSDFESEYRIVLPDGSVRHIHNIGHPRLNEAGEVAEFVGTVIDVTEARQAEEKIRQSEREARQILDLSPMHITLLGPGVERIYNNQAALDYYGLTLDDWRKIDSPGVLHPQDVERGVVEIPRRFQEGAPFEMELRLRRKDGQYRCFHYRFSPMRDEQGRITRWYVAGTDIEDRKAAEQRLLEENVSLREEIDKASMFEEIVGASEPLRKVVARISRVAPTDSGVLITGETGTGKELVARAIHRRSRRSAYAFVSVNCAAIPRDLIASELFGHEKGAFTGATQRRSGRFELAAGGTIFLDEVGELPAETQVALLRVLQEREFERVGGSGSIRTDVRVIAATNRDLEAAIGGGTFRSDLYYRLNVFPIEMPTLRERRDDIPLLVEYFLDRYARKAGKSFQAVDRKSVELLQSYPWPGNIRELQNVIERSVIVSEAGTFSVDESWLSRQPRAAEPAIPGELSQKLAAQEKEIVEAALRECGGRVSGPSGAAARLGMPGSTLESKIRALKIDKNRFRPGN